MTRDAAIAKAEDYFDSGDFRAHLARRVAIPTESQNPDRRSVLTAYIKSEMVPACEADLDDDEAMSRTLAAAAAAFGGIDVVFANAGSYRDATLGSATREVFSAVLATNIIGVFMTVQQALPRG